MIVVCTDIPVVSIAGENGLPIPGDNVTLICSATGDTPFTYQWTIEGNDTDILNTNTSVGMLELMDIQENQFGIYICTVINDLGQGMSSLDVIQAGMLNLILK